MALFSRTPAVESAEAAVADLVATVAKWTAQADTAAAEAEALADRVGELALDDEAAGAQAAVDIAALRGQVSVARAAAGAAGRRLEAARRTVLTERAAVLRARADRLDAAAKARQVRTDELLASLATFEACPYVPELSAPMLTAVPGGTRAGAYPMTLSIARHAEWLGQRADELERQARDLTADQLAGALGKPLPEVSNLDKATADDGTFTGDAARHNRVVRSSV